jgi:pyridoxine 4-dehydrogenase
MAGGGGLGLGLDLSFHTCAGKYSSSKLPSGPRGQIYGAVLEQMDPLLAYMRQLGQKHGKTLPQVSLNYLLCQVQR